MSLITLVVTTLAFYRFTSNMLRIIPLIFTFLFLFCFSCKQAEDKREHELPVLVDTFKYERIQFEADSASTTWYWPAYIGKLTDTIRIDYLLYPRFYSELNSLDTSFKYVFRDTIMFRDDDSASFSVNSEEVFLKIYIDTTKMMSQFIIGRHDVVKSFPVFIYNLSFVKVILGADGIINLTYEALNPEGKWQAIEDKFRFDHCTNDYTRVLLPIGQIALTSAVIYKGSFKTKLRVRLGQFYSNEFSGSINLGQFVREEE
jgi:hypothetical protein